MSNFTSINGQVGNLLQATEKKSNKFVLYRKCMFFEKSLAFQFTREVTSLQKVSCW